MPKTEFQRELETRPQGVLINLCDQLGLDHTGDREAVIARLVAYEEAKGTEPETHGTEPETQGTEPEPEPEPEPQPAPEPEPEPEPGAED
ncbi:hypothetical protein ES703_115636 [subsurface metagenome]